VSSPPGRPSRRLRVLLVTPATRFGSWAIIEKVIRASVERVSWSIVSFGQLTVPIDGVEVRALPELGDYARLSRLLSRRRLLWLNGVYLLPLAPLTWWVAARRRVRVVVANGAAAALAAAPVRLFGVRIVLSWNGYIGHAGPGVQRLTAAVLRVADTAIVNSPGSADDLATVFDRSRIRVVPHWADRRFFDTPLERVAHDKLEVLFVGRLDDEKFAQCLRVCAALAERGLVRLTAVGSGPLAARVTGPGLRFLGYVADLDQLADVYHDADVVWAPADVTYVSVPGVEGLASGCPLIVSDVPAVDAHAAAGARVPKSLLPETIGVVVDGLDDEQAADAVATVALSGVGPEQREACRAYALERHSPANIELILESLGL
jgi:glycosyltransferase involved in cell wall biosynthesis